MAISTTQPGPQGRHHQCISFSNGPIDLTSSHPPTLDQAPPPRKRDDSSDMSGPRRWSCLQQNGAPSCFFCSPALISAHLTPRPRRITGEPSEQVSLAMQALKKVQVSILCGAEQSSGTLSPLGCTNHNGFPEISQPHHPTSLRAVR